MCFSPKLPGATVFLDEIFCAVEGHYHVCVLFGDSGDGTFQS